MEQIRTTYKNDIFVSWEEKTVPFHIASFTSHNAYEIYVLLKGERRVYIGEKIFETHAGAAAMIAANVSHRSEGTTPYRGICIQFTEKQLDGYFTPRAKKQLLACFAREVISLDKSELSELQLLLCRMPEEPERKFMYLPAVLALFLRAVEREKECLAGNGHMAENGRGAVRTVSGKASGAVSVRAIESYLQENAGKIKSLEEIAAHFCITKGYLCTFFKKRTGMTVVAYLNNIRIQEACRLLDATEDSVEQVSVRCGFQSPVYFHRLFKKMMHYTPAKYRVVIRQSHREADGTSESANGNSGK